MRQDDDCASSTRDTLLHRLLCSECLDAADCTLGVRLWRCESNRRRQPRCPRPQFASAPTADPRARAVSRRSMAAEVRPDGCACWRRFRAVLDARRSKLARGPRSSHDHRPRGAPCHGARRRGSWTLKGWWRRAVVHRLLLRIYFASKDFHPRRLVGTSRAQLTACWRLDASLGASLEHERPFAVAVSAHTSATARRAWWWPRRLGHRDTLCWRATASRDVAIRLRSFFPKRWAEYLAETMRMINAAIVMSPERCAKLAAPTCTPGHSARDLSCSMLRARHGEPRQG